MNIIGRFFYAVLHGFSEVISYQPLREHSMRSIPSKSPVIHRFYSTRKRLSIKKAIFIRLSLFF